MGKEVDQTKTEARSCPIASAKRNFHMSRDREVILAYIQANLNVMLT